MANAPSIARRSQGSSIPTIVFGIVWSLFSSIFVCFGLKTIWKGVSQSTWEKGSCVIERFEIKADQKKHPVFQPDLKFYYEWEGRPYTGSQLRSDQRGSDEYEKLSAIREELLAEAQRDRPEGLRTGCWVDPQHPDQASLVKPSWSGWGGLFIVAFGSVFMLVGFSVIRSGMKSRSAKALSDRSPQGSQPTFPLVIFFGIFTAIGLGFTCFVVIPGATRYLSSQTWVETPATVIWSRVESHSGSKGGSTYSVDLFYRYQFQGREYRSNSYNLTSGSSSGRDAKQEIVDAHPPNSSITCYVNPQKPWQAAVDRTLGAGILFGLIPLIFLSIGFGGMIWALKNRRADTARPIDPVSSKAASSEPIPDLPERILSAGKARLVNLAASFFICAFWNGIVSIPIGIAWNAWKKGSPETFLMIFLTPFVLIGTGLLLNVPYRLLMVFLARYELRLTPGTLKPGGSATLTWKRLGGLGQPKSISLRLTGTEIASWQNGKSRSSATSFFHDEVLADLSLNSISANRPIAIRLPESVVPTFKGDSNKIVWKLRMEVTLPGFPKITDDHEIDVRPLRRDELNPST